MIDKTVLFMMANYNNSDVGETRFLKKIKNNKNFKIKQYNIMIVS